MKHSTTWLLKFFAIALECDFPILEAIYFTCHYSPFQEFWNQFNAEHPRSVNVSSVSILEKIAHDQLNWNIIPPCAGQSLETFNATPEKHNNYILSVNLGAHPLICQRYGQFGLKLDFDLSFSNYILSICEYLTGTLSRLVQVGPRTKVKISIGDEMLFLSKQFEIFLNSEKINFGTLITYFRYMNDITNR